MKKRKMIQRTICYSMVLLLVIGACFGFMPGSALKAKAEGATQTIEIGVKGTVTTNSYIPSYSFYNYSVTQTIYTPTEMGNKGGTIDRVSFYCSSTSGYSRSLKIYLMDTDVTSLNSGWVNIANATCCYDGSLTFVADSWNELVFTNTFSHDNTKNLLLCVYDVTGSWAGRNYFKAYENSDIQSLYRYSDGYNYYESDPYPTDPSKPGFKVSVIFGLSDAIELLDPTVVAPTQKDSLIYNGSAQELVNPGSVEGGTMYYALGEDGINAPTDGWSTAVPKGTEADGLYYVWYKVVGDEGYNDVAPDCLPVAISQPDRGDLSNAIVEAVNYYGEIMDVYPDIAEELKGAIIEAIVAGINPKATAEDLAAIANALRTAIENAKNKVAALECSDAWLDPLRTQINIGLEVIKETGNPVTVYYASDFSLPYEIMKKLQDNPKLTLVYTMSYKEEDYVITLPGSKVVADPEIPWYGPLYLMEKYK